MTKALERTTFFHFDTYCSLAADVDADVLSQAEQLCTRFEHLYSRFDAQSALYRINAAQGQWVQVDDELAAALATALGYCERTDGLFDITMGGVCALWDFKQGVVPPAERIEAARRHVDWHKVEIDGNRVRLRDPHTVLDLGGVAKGIIADALADFLVGAGATSGCINLGGNVLTIGLKPDGEPWRVGLRTPVPSDDPFQAPIFATIVVEGKSVVTSGVFERAFAFEGQLLHHILDPRTGAPAVTDVLSATVISDRSTDGDGFTTALVIQGAESALAFAESQPEIEAILLTASGEILHTQGIQGPTTALHLA